MHNYKLKVDNTCDVRGASCDDTLQELRELWVHTPDRVRQVIQDKLRYFARADEGESSGETEFSRFQASFNVRLHGKPEDPFGAIARSLTSINDWALTATC